MSATFTRRDILALGTLGLGGAALAARRTGGKKGMPALFVSHGSPMVAVSDDDYTQALAAFGKKHPAPKAIVVVSAHFETRGGILVTATATPPTIHDFGGFPPPLYAITYPAPGSPELAARIVRMLAEEGLPAALDERRGLDHGSWVPLRIAYPAARIPVVALSLPRPREPAELLRMGLALEPLRQEGILLVGSGGVTHNLGMVDFDAERGPVRDWAARFDSWVRGKLESLDVEGLVGYPANADARIAHPTTEHFDPLFFVLGAAQEGDRVAHVYEGFRHGTLSMRCFTLAGDST